MIKNYFKTAIRNLLRNKGFSLINLSGLALGLACCILIFLWVTDELNTDSFHANKTQLYSVYERQFYNDKVDAFHSTPGLMADEMKRSFPEVEYASGFGWITSSGFEVGDKTIKQEGSWAGEDFFKMFSYRLLEGDATTALNSPSSIAVSKRMAESFFGSVQNAINKTIRFQSNRDFKITAVFDNIGKNASVKFDYLINWYAYLDDNQWLKNWTININDGPRTYIMLKPGMNATAFENKIKHFLDSYFKGQNTGFRIELGVQRFDQMYLRSHFKDGKIAGGRIEYVQLFSVIAVFILLIACVNFMNLTTARFMKRAKEIGVRKVAGAVRGTLIKQFIGEATFTASISLVIALAVVIAALPVFNGLTQKEIVLPVYQPGFWLNILIIALVTGLIAGSYPAFFLSSFHPVKVLKGPLKAGPGAALFRKGLVVFQFVLSITAIIGTVIVSQQIDYIRTKNLGYDKDHVISIPLEANLTSQYNVFRLEAVNIPGIKSVTRITQIPTEITSGTSDVSWQNKSPNEKTLFIWAGVGYDFAKTLNLQFLQGRDFSKEFSTDSSGFILNETAVKAMNYKDPVGRQFNFWGQTGTIIGVVKDFHFTSLHDPIRPLILRLGEKEAYGTALIKIEAAKTQEALQGLGALSKQISPKFPLSFRFLDDAYKNLYTSEQVIGKLSGYFAFLAVFISCLGLLGLAMFTAEQRTKEIGIRKVLGANTASLFVLLSKDFLLLVFIAFIIASPLGWWATHTWLSDYAYRIDISWRVFLWVGLLALFIALITVSYQAIKAAVVNPMKSLRTE